MTDPTGKMPVDKLAELRAKYLAADLLRELYPPLDPNAAELIEGIDEADWWPEPDDGPE